MHIYFIFTTAIALSMDAFAVAISCGICGKADKLTMQIKLALYFGVFQGVMPIIGWMLAYRFSQYINSIDHWIAFGLLSLIGVKMIVEARDVSCKNIKQLSHYQLFLLALATSIDALATGISFAILNLNIFVISLLIGVTTFGLSFFGARFGQNIGSKYQKGAETLGGIILITMGVKILLEHLLGI